MLEPHLVTTVSGLSLIDSGMLRSVHFKCNRLINISDRIGAAAQVLHDDLMDATRILPPSDHLGALPRFTPYEQDNMLSIPDAVNGNSPAARIKAAKIVKARLAKVPRPANAFILYRQVKHQVIKSSQPTTHNNEISKIVGRMWAAEEPHVKNYFQRKAKDLKAQHAIMHPGYQYAPRKAFEKKRRASKQRARGGVVQPTDPPGTHTVGQSQPVPSFPEVAPGIRVYEPVDGQDGLFLQMIEQHNAQFDEPAPSLGDVCFYSTYSTALEQDMQMDALEIDHAKFNRQHLESLRQPTSMPISSAFEGLPNLSLGELHWQGSVDAQDARISELCETVPITFLPTPLEDGSFEGSFNPIDISDFYSNLEIDFSDYGTFGTPTDE